MKLTSHNSFSLTLASVLALAVTPSLAHAQVAPTGGDYQASPSPQDLVQQGGSPYASQVAQPAQGAPQSAYDDDGVTYGSGNASRGGVGTVGADSNDGVTGASVAPSAQMRPAAGRPSSAAVEEVDATGAGGADTPVSGQDTQRHNALGMPMSNAPRVTFHPYIEAGEVADWGISPRTQVLTYTEVAVGADAQFNGNNTQGTVSLRYQRNIGYGEQASGDSVTGLARMATAIIPGALRLDYGGLATRAYVSSSGAVNPDVAGPNLATSQIYSGFVGPTLHTHMGLAQVDGHYRLGYTKVGSPDFGTVAAGQTNPQAFSHSWSQDAGGAITFAPHEPLPVGIGFDGNWSQENDSLLGQRSIEEHIHGTLTVPVTHSLAVIGGLGFEHDQVASYNAVVDANGNPVLSGNGQYISNTAAGRQIAFDTSGLIWDAGVVWKPGPRTSLEMHYGRRYGSDGAWGTFSWRPDQRQSINVQVNDTLSGLGGGLSSALASSPTDFVVIPNPTASNIGSCVATLQGGGCIAAVLGSATAPVYHDQSVSATYGLNLGRWQTGFGGGYDRRTLITGTNNVLGSVDGERDQYYWVDAYASDKLSPHSSILASVNLYRFNSGAGSVGDSTSVHAGGTYQHNFTQHLTASASLAVDGVNLDSLNESWAASGALNMRYSF